MAGISLSEWKLIWIIFIWNICLLKLLNVLNRRNCCCLSNTTEFWKCYRISKKNLKSVVCNQNLENIKIRIAFHVGMITTLENWIQSQVLVSTKLSISFMERKYDVCQWLAIQKPLAISNIIRVVYKICIRQNGIKAEHKTNNMKKELLSRNNFLQRAR